MNIFNSSKRSLFALVLTSALCSVGSYAEQNYYLEDAQKNRIDIENLSESQRALLEQGLEDLNGLAKTSDELSLGESTSYFSFNDFVGGILDTVKDVAGNLIGSLSSVADKLKNAMIKAGMTLVDGFGTIYNTVYQGIAISVFKVTKDLWTDGKDLFLRVGDTILKTVKDLPDAIVKGANVAVLKTINTFIGVFNQLAEKIGVNNINAAVIVLKSILTTGKLPDSLEPPPPESANQDLPPLNLSATDVAALETEKLCITNPNDGTEVCGTQDQLVAIASTWDLEGTEDLSANLAPSLESLEAAATEAYPGAPLSPAGKFLAKQALLLMAVAKKADENFNNLTGTARQQMTMQLPKAKRDALAFLSAVVGSVYAAKKIMGIP